MMNDNNYNLLLSCCDDHTQNMKKLSNKKKNKKKLRKKNKNPNGDNHHDNDIFILRNCLLSIQYDIQIYLQPIIQQLYETLLSNERRLHIIANERCGMWYAYPFLYNNHEYNDKLLHLYIPNMNHHHNTSRDDVVPDIAATKHNNPSKKASINNCYFKSTDGHHWDFSLKRLNLHLLALFNSIKDTNGNDNDNDHSIICILDSSASKELPDSFSRTIPLWSTVINRITERYRNEILVSTTPDHSQLHNHNNDDHNVDINTVIPNFWDNQFYMYHSIEMKEKEEVLKEKNDESENKLNETLINDHVNLLYDSCAIVSPKWLISTLHKPLKPYYIIPSYTTEQISKIIQQILIESKQYSCIICVMCSNIYHTNNNMKHGDDNKNSFHYIPGAADDHESWSRQLTPSLFWNNYNDIIFSATSYKASHTNQDTNHVAESSSMIRSTDDDCCQVKDNNDYEKIVDSSSITKIKNTNVINDNHNQLLDEIIDRIVQEQRNKDRTVSNIVEEEPITSNNTNEITMNLRHSNDDDDDYESTYDMIGQLDIAIGTRRSGRPPICWNHFDAIINVTEYDYFTNTTAITKNEDDSDTNQHNNNKVDIPLNKYYIQLPVHEGKRDRYELEKWLPIGIIFALYHNIIHQRKLLIHCAQGKDRSVAVAMSIIQLFTNCRYPLQWNIKYYQEEQFIQSFHTFLEQTINITSKNNNNGVHEATKVSDQPDNYYRLSGLHNNVVSELLDRKGRDLLLNWLSSYDHHDNVVHEENNDVVVDTRIINNMDVTKHSLRIVLHLIRQDRVQAEPSRSTMQKLNRFFMSHPYEK